MLEHRPTAAERPRWLPLVGAAVALAPAIYLTYLGIDYGRNGCDCGEPLFPDWSWAPMLVVAVPFYAAALALVVRALRRRSAAG